MFDVIPEKAAVMFVVPIPVVKASPVLLMVATDEFEEFQVADVVKSCTELSE